MDAFRRKVLIIGIDGASWNIFDEIINNDYMPYLKKLKEDGAYGSIFSTIPPISPSAWGTLQTGIDAINHHIYEFYCFDKIKKDIKIVNSKFLKNTIWEILSQVGKKVAVINVPMTYPPKKVNGYIISGILTPSLESNFTYPKELKDYILNDIPDYQLRYSEDVRYGKPHNNIKSFVQQRIKNIKDRTNVCVWLLNNFKIDIIMVNFQANDILQHIMWGYIDKNNKLYNKDIKLYIFRHFHKALDSCIKTIREEFIKKSSGDLLTIILSDHGCESHLKRFCLGDWLYRKKLLKIRLNVTKSVFRRKLRELMLKTESSHLQVKLLNFLRKIEQKIKNKSQYEQETHFLPNIVDLEQSYAISFGISLYGLIFILKNGKKRDKIVKHLKKELYAIRDPESGETIVDKVYEREEIYSGDNPNLIPDLVIKPKRGYSFTGLFQNQTNLFQKINKITDFAIGKHNEQGILIINEPAIINSRIDGANLADIVPTILNYFQIPISNNLDGKPLKYFN